MEPISLAFEITSLSMQLVGMVKTIKELVTSYRSAAQVLEELCLRLDTIETICDCLGASLSQASSSIQKPELLPLLNSLKRSVQECYGKVSNVNQVIAKVYAKLESTRNPFKTLGVSFLRYRPELATYVDSLDSSLSLLHGIMAAMSVVLNMKSSKESGLSMPVNHSSPRTAHLPPMPEFDATNHSLPSQQISKDLIKTWRHQFSSLVILQKTQKSRIQDLNTSNTQSSIFTQEGSTFTLGSSLLNTYIQLSIMRGALAPFSIRLQIPRVLLISEDATGVGESVRKAFESDDLQATQDLFSQGFLTTATVVTYTEYDPEDEASLLGLAMSLQSRKIFNFLKCQMDLSEPRNHAARSSFPYRTPRSDEAFACILEYIHVRKALMTPAEFGILLLISKARQITACVEACRQYFPYNWDRFDDVILTEVSYGFSRLSADQMSIAQLGDWAPLFTDIVGRSQELVSSSEYHQFRATIWFILWYAFDPDDAWYRVCRWVDLLDLAQIDVANYLKGAIKYCSDSWVETKSWGIRGLEDSAVRRPLRLRHHKGRTLPYWIEYADDSCPIRELFTEFPTLRYMDKRIRWHSWCGRASVYKQWNSGRNLDASHFSMMYWPVIPPLDRYSTMDSDGKNRPHLADWADRACELQKRRFERKERRRHQKLNGKGSGRRRIPGTWVE